MKSNKVLAALIASALLISPSFAYEITPLPTGKPAGIQQAALLGTTTRMLIGLGLAGLSIAFAVGAFNKSKSTSTTGTSS